MFLGQTTMKTEQPWYAARCLFEHRSTPGRTGVPCYEERVVVVRARSFGEAIRKGESEAKRYAGTGPGSRYLGFIEVFHLFAAALKNGTEVFSVMRSKAMSEARFIKTYYDDGSFHRGTQPTRRQAAKPAEKASQQRVALARSTPTR